MIMQFPVAHDDELLVSILARFVARQGLQDDKVALEMLFGSRNIVPSPLLQGHIQALLCKVNNIWLVSDRDVIHRHSILPFFQSFIEPARIKTVENELIFSDKPNVMTSIGINASNINWPRYYRFCPECLTEDYKYLAYSYWRRSFQLPGVLVCSKHLCYLQNSPFKLLPDRRHRFCNASQILPNKKITLMHLGSDDKLTKLAVIMQKLLETKTPYVSPVQWTIFYRNCISELGLLIGQRADHTKIRILVESFWGSKFLEQHGLSIKAENNWLLAFFRKQRRHYTALHHAVCMMAILPSYSIFNAIKEASLITIKSCQKKVYTNKKALERVDEYRASWLAMCSQFGVLKDIRATPEGARIYSWLFRFDNTWLKKYLPDRVRNDEGRQINWSKRDVELVRKLILIRNKSYENLGLPRMTQTWFIGKTNVSWGVASHLDKLPLCRDFFIKYKESIDEYQIRRVLAIMVNHINLMKPLPQPYEIERIAGLNQKRNREAVKLILRMDFEKFSRFKIPS
tara:strand:- start:25697 stop:27238 length:1542 start_codon:yes stop_codon:yes gene_type:complete